MVITTERGIGEYSLFQMITDKDANAFVEIGGFKGPGFRLLLYFLYGLIYLALPLGSLETSSSHPVAPLDKRSG